MSFWAVRNVAVVQWFRGDIKNWVYFGYIEFILQVHFHDCSGINTIQFMFLHFNFPLYSSPYLTLGLHS